MSHARSLAETVESSSSGDDSAPKNYFSSTTDNDKWMQMISDWEKALWFHSVLMK